MRRAEGRPGSWARLSEASTTSCPGSSKRGYWENGYEDKYLGLVRSMRTGDQIAVKAAYRRKNGLPFDNRGQDVSVMAIKAIGTITENMNDGRHVRVDWKKVEPSARMVLLHPPGNGVACAARGLEGRRADACGPLTSGCCMLYASDLFRTRETRSSGGRHPDDLPDLVAGSSPMPWSKGKGATEPRLPPRRPCWTASGDGSTY